MTEHTKSGTETAKTPPVPALENPYASPKARKYALAVLTLVYTFNFIDRQLLSILQESIKVDLSLSDSQLGLLTGFAFAMFYVTAGIPIARLADRGNRRNIVAISVGLWSAMTAVSGLVQNYGQLLAARVGVGVGEDLGQRRVRMWAQGLSGAEDPAARRPRGLCGAVALVAAVGQQRLAGAGAVVGARQNVPEPPRRLAL